jgi:hypothetical protein
VPRWIKQGLLFEPPTALGWMRTHAAIPYAEPLGDLYRVYFSGRDAENRARIGYFDLDLTEPVRVVRVGNEPVIGTGPLGAFDDHGVTGSWIVTQGGRTFHYYTGWTLGVTVPFYVFAGLAVSEDGGTFHRVSPAPILERNATDPYLTASPCVLIEGELWRMWYVSGTRWESGLGTPRHYYHVRYAESRDGIAWDRRGIVCIDHRGDEFAIARPCVVRDGERYRMWYSYRGASYRIGYAESADGIQWMRKDDEAGIAVSPSGWDSDMIAYAFVFAHAGRLYMLYNGNEFGKTGIGLACLTAVDELKEGRGR